MSIKADVLGLLRTVRSWFGVPTKKTIWVNPSGLKPGFYPESGLYIDVDDPIALRVQQPLTKDDALSVFRCRYRSPELTIHEIGQSGPNPEYPYRSNSWFILFQLDNSLMHRSSRLICISKANGEIVYGGLANDEG